MVTLVLRCAARAYFTAVTLISTRLPGARSVPTSRASTWSTDSISGIDPPESGFYAKVLVYRGSVGGPTDAAIGELIASGTIGLHRVYEADIPRRPEWLGI